MPLYDFAGLASSKLCLFDFSYPNLLYVYYVCTIIRMTIEISIVTGGGSFGSLLLQHLLTTGACYGTLYGTSTSTTVRASTKEVWDPGAL
jgi:hypothetical protein